ncbi:MAG: hypothetical protein KKE11_02475 [Gammaproteobacteria bacterium]|nr:hypothetical protein [Gammaproteobacteria bacterium]
MKNNIVGLSQAEINCINGGSKDPFPLLAPKCDPSDPACQEKIRRYRKPQMQWACKKDIVKVGPVKNS